MPLEKKERKETELSQNRNQKKFKQSRIIKNAKYDEQEAIFQRFLCNQNWKDIKYAVEERNSYQRRKVEVIGIISDSVVL